MGKTVIDEWRRFQEQGWERRKYGPGKPRPNETDDSLETTNVARREVVAAAYLELQKVFRAKTADWKARFQYRRATVGLFTQYDAYSKLTDLHSASSQTTAPQRDRSILLRALFRDMRPEWRNALPCAFTDGQAKHLGYGSEWQVFNRAIRDGRRWEAFVRDLGLGALLLIDTTGNIDYLQQKTPVPVFIAWTKLLPRVRPDVKDVGERIYCYFDTMEEPSYAGRKLRPLKLERRAYRDCSPGEQFDFSGSEGRRTPTVNPSFLGQPSEAMLLDESAMEEFMIFTQLED